MEAETQVLVNTLLAYLTVADLKMLLEAVEKVSYASYGRVEIDIHKGGVRFISETVRRSPRVT